MRRQFKNGDRSKHEAERCHRLGYIAYGELLAQGTAEELRARFGVTRLEDVFIQVMQTAQEPA